MNVCVCNVCVRVQYASIYVRMRVCMHVYVCDFGCPHHLL